MALGELGGRILRVAPGERLAYVIEIGFRNLGLAVVVTVTLLRQEGFLAFAIRFMQLRVVRKNLIGAVIQPQVVQRSANDFGNVVGELLVFLPAR